MGKRIAGCVAVIVIAVVAAAALYSNYYFARMDYFLPGVKIGSVPVQGHSLKQAEQEVNHWLQENMLTPVVFYSGAYQYRATLQELCVPVDAARIVEEVLVNEARRSWTSKVVGISGDREHVYDVFLSYDPEVENRLYQQWQAELGKEAIDAYLEMDKTKGLVVVPAQIGNMVDTKATMKQLPEKCSNFEQLQVPIVLLEQYPLITEADLEKMGELSTYTTWYKVSEVDRSHNLSLAASIINGTMVKPGEVFSFNRKVGPRTGTTGYRDALVIVGDKYEPGIGGGICQVSSTLYNACLLAGLEIIERHNHALAVAYIPLGLDATVAYGLQDYQFRNNTDYPVYIRAAAGGGQLTVTIYGHADYKKNIKLSYVIDQTTDFQEIAELDPEMSPGEEKLDHNGFPGYHVRSFRTYYNDQGAVIESELLANDRYRPLNKLTFIGPPLPDGEPTGGDEPELPDHPPEEDEPPETNNDNPGGLDSGHQDDAAPTVTL